MLKNKEYCGKQDRRDGEDRASVPGGTLSRFAAHGYAVYFVLDFMTSEI